MVPAVVEAWADLLMEAVEDGDLVVAGCCNDVFDMFYGVGSCEVIVQETVEFAIWVEEVVVWVD